jgi:hypothetical protein
MFDDFLNLIYPIFPICQFFARYLIPLRIQLFKLFKKLLASYQLQKCQVGIAVRIFVPEVVPRVHEDVGAALRLGPTRGVKLGLGFRHRRQEPRLLGCCVGLKKNEED